jgi:hypothetical protein
MKGQNLKPAFRTPNSEMVEIGYNNEGYSNLLFFTAEIAEDAEKFEDFSLNSATSAVK